MLEADVVKKIIRLCKLEMKPVIFLTFNTRNRKRITSVFYSGKVHLHI